MQVKKNEAYPFLLEDSKMCDYEIETDLYASEIGLLYAYIDDEDKAKLEHMCELVYHCNPCIRNENKITDYDVYFLRGVENSYKEYNVTEFLLPLDSNAVAGMCHVLRSKSKKMIRMLVYLEKSEDRKVDTRIYAVFNILAQIFFQLAVKYSDKKVNFKSRTY